VLHLDVSKVDWVLHLSPRFFFTSPQCFLLRATAGHLPPPTPLIDVGEVWVAQVHEGARNDGSGEGCIGPRVASQDGARCGRPRGAGCNAGGCWVQHEADRTDAAFRARFGVGRRKLRALVLPYFFIYFFFPAVKGPCLVLVIN
jgi:hypothetical protein